MVPSLIELIQQPQYVGSRYLRAMLLHPDKYELVTHIPAATLISHPRFSIPVDLVRGVLRAAYSLLWRDESTLFLPATTLSFIREKLVPTIAIKPSSEATGVMNVGSGDCPVGVFPMLAQITETGSQVTQPTSNQCSLLGDADCWC